MLGAAQQVVECELNQNKNSKPALALKLGTTFTGTTEELLAQAIQKGDPGMKARCESSEGLFKLSWPAEFTAHVHRTNVENNKKHDSKSSIGGGCKKNVYTFKKGLCCDNPVLCPKHQAIENTMGYYRSQH